MDPEERVPRPHELKIRIKPEFLLKKAREETGMGNFSKAFEHYVEYLDNLNNPSLMPLLDQNDFTKVALKLAQYSEEMDADEEILKFYVQVINFFPKNAIILNALATYLFKKGEFDIAWKYLVKASAEDYLPAEKNLLHVIWHLIPRWHFRMLNDKVRNESYKKAIRKAIRAGFKNVYDIGTGCGLLTLIAAKSSAQVRVTAFEENKTLFELAKKVFEDNNVLKTVTAVQLNSSLYKPPVKSVKCDLIVTEIFDAGLFGEGCLETLFHAVNNFVGDRFRIIPSSAKLFVTAFENDEYSRKFRITKNMPELGLENLCIRMVDPEPYDAEFIDRKTTKFITSPREFFSINFSDKIELLNLLTREDVFPIIDLECVQEGTIHGFAVWFDLNLDHDTKISTKPGSGGVRCWEQAIFNMDHPVDVEVGEIVRLRPRLVNNQLNFHVLDRSRPCNCFEVTKEIITYLNDEKLVKSIVDLVESYTDYNLKILDFQVFPLFGLLMAKKGATMFHVYRDFSDLRLFEHIVEANNLSKLKCVFVHEKAMEEHLVYLSSVDLVFNDMIKNDGSWNRMALTEETEAKLNAQPIPRKLFLQAQVVRSDYLDFCNKVDDKKALRFGIARHLNEFSGTEHPSLESFDHDKYSAVVTFDISDFDLIDYQMEAEILKDGSFNGILYWFIFQYTEDEKLSFSTLDSTFYGKTCAYFKKPKSVKKGQKVNIRIAREECYMKVYCD